MNNLLRAGWKAQPSSLRGGKRRGAGLPGKPEAFRKSGRQSRSQRRHALVIWTVVVLLAPSLLAIVTTLATTPTLDALKLTSEAVATSPTAT
jgi:hypothetical protein